MARIHLVIDGSRGAETLQFGPKFGFDSLPEAEQHIAEPFAVAARAVIDALTDGPLLARALTELLSARQYAIRAARAAGYVIVADGSRVLLDARLDARLPREVIEEGLHTLRPGAAATVSPAQALGYEPVNQVGTVEQQPAVDRAALEAGYIGGYDPDTDRLRG